MHWEKDYTKPENRGVLLKEGDIESAVNEDNKLDLYMRYYRLWDSQYERIFSQTKKDKIFHLYNQLKMLAFLHNGKISLDINEVEMKAKLIYWGECLAVLPDQLDISKGILLDVLDAADLVYLSAADGGVEIRIEEEFCENIEIKNEQERLSELKELIHNHKA